MKYFKDFLQFKNLIKIFEQEKTEVKKTPYEEKMGDESFDIKKDTENYGLKIIKEKIKRTLFKLEEYSLAKATLSSIDTNDIKSKIPFCIQCFFELALFR